MGFNFELSADAKLLQDGARKFVLGEVIPVAARFDESGEFPAELISKAWDTGFLNVTIPAEIGGTGLSCLDSCVVVEELAYGCAGVTTSCVANDLALIPINLAGTPEQKNQYIAELLDKKGLASFCLSEPGAGSDVAGMSARLEKVEGGYRLSGRWALLLGRRWL